MSRPSRRLPALAATFALVVGGLTLGQTTAARADDFCEYQDTTKPKITGYAPTSVTIGLTSKLVRFSVKASDNCPIDSWTITTPDDYFFFVYKESPKETITVPYDNDDAGSTAADVTAYDQAYNQETRRFTFKLLRHTRWTSLNAGPEPVRKGRDVTITASLQLADWEKDAYVRFGGSAQRATVQFKAKGGTTWTNVKRVGFTSTGRVSTKLAAKGTTGRDGWYRIHIAGSSTYAAAVSKVDYVDVK